MDDVFQILIYILIAVSFLSSLFKKKKPVQPPPEDSSSLEASNIADRQYIESPQFAVQETENTDIIKEIESFFNLSDSPPPEKPSAPKHDDKEVYEGAKERDNYLKVPEESFHKRSESEHTFTDPWDEKRKEVEKRKKTITPEIEEQASAYQENFEKKETASTEIIEVISERIQDPASLKEYIIISEIIGKPKALSR